MKKIKLKSIMIMGLVALGIGLLSFSTLNAESVYQDSTLSSLSLDESKVYTVEEMLQYAIADEYRALAEYQAIIETFGEIRPFTNIVKAEQAHISLLLPLFETYGVTVPEDNGSSYVVIPETISSAIATGKEAEIANIALYEQFLSQDNLPDDVRDVFESLVQASESHLAAFSRDRYYGYANDMMNQVKNQFRKAFQSKNQAGNQFKTANGQCRSN